MIIEVIPCYDGIVHLRVVGYNYVTRSRTWRLKALYYLGNRGNSVNIKCFTLIKLFVFLLLSSLFTKTYLLFYYLIFQLVYWIKYDVISHEKIKIIVPPWQKLAFVFRKQYLEYKKPNLAI